MILSFLVYNKTGDVRTNRKTTLPKHVEKTPIVPTGPRYTASSVAKCTAPQVTVSCALGAQMSVY